MIASPRGVIALAIVAIGLAIAALVGSATGPTQVDRAVLPHLDTAPTQLAWTRPRGPDVTIARAPGGGWTMLKPKAECDERAVEAVLATLRGARWHRRGDRGHAGTIHATLALTGHVIELGDPIHGADQAWIVVDGTAMLVDGWVARSLDPDPLALRDRSLLADAASSKTITIIRANNERIVVHDRPWRDSHGVLAPDVTGALVRALERLELVRVADGPIDVTSATMIVIDHEVTVSVGGQCPGDPHLIGLASAAGDGCVDPAAWHDVETIVARLEGPAADVIDRRLAAGPVSKIRLRDGMIDLDKRPTVVIDGTSHLADPDRVAELVAALAAPATLVALPPVGARGTMVVEFRDGGSIELLRYATTYARPGEVLAMEPEPPFRDVLERPLPSYLDPTRWLEDTTAVASLAIDGIEVERGAVLGEWTRDSAALAPADAALVDALATAVAQVRAPIADVPAAWRPAHTIRVSFAPPVGAPTTHVAELGPPGPDGCLARFDHAPGHAPLALCTAAQSVVLRR